jgi:hypothetical protein
MCSSRAPHAEEIENWKTFSAPLLYIVSTSEAPSSRNRVEAARVQDYDPPKLHNLGGRKAVREVLAEIKPGFSSHLGDRCATFAEFMELAGLPEIQEAEQRAAA